MAPAPNPSYPGPSFKDWALLAISLGFVAIGVCALPSKPNVGWVTLAFFGLCAAVFTAILLQKLRFRRQRPLRAEIAGGAPIRPSRAKLFAAGAGLWLVGGILVAFGAGYGALFWAASLCLALVGAALLLGLAAGWLPVGYLQFDPVGITIARRRWAFTIPWDHISQVAAGEYQSNPALSLWIEPLEAVQAIPPKAAPQVRAHLLSSQRWVGSHVLLMTSQYNLDLPLLMKALERYLKVPASRAELSRPRLP